MYDVELFFDFGYLWGEIAASRVREIENSTVKGKKIKTMSKNKKQPLSYEKAMKELQEIVIKMQEGKIGIDDLSEKVAYAKELIGFCKEKLRTTEEEIKDLND